MKKIEAYLKPFRLQDLRRELAMRDLTVLRVHQVEEIRPAAPYSEVVQGVEYETDVASRLLVVLLVEDDQVEEAIGLLQRVARTDHCHDGRILITAVDRSVPVDPAEQVDLAEVDLAEVDLAEQGNAGTRAGKSGRGS